jgi:hypothetical protein
MKKTSVFATLLAGALLALAPGCRNDGTQRGNAAQPAGATNPGASANTPPSPPASDRQPVSGTDKGDKADKPDPASPTGTGTGTATEGSPQANPPTGSDSKGAAGKSGATVPEVIPTSGGTAATPDAGAKK